MRHVSVWLRNRLRLPAWWAKYFYYRLQGRSFAEYYADLLNRGVRLGFDASCLPGHRERGSLQLEYLKSHGLRSDHTLLDFGCGYGRAAVHFIRFLNADRYVGVDISQERLGIARQLIAREKLEHKGPQFICNTNCRLGELQGLTFDFIWAYGVLGHMPRDDVRKLFEHLPSIMHSRSVAFMTGYFLPEGTPLPLSRRVSVVDFYYREDLAGALAERCGLEYAFMDDFAEKLDFGDIEPKYDRMVRLQLKRPGGT